MKYSPSILARLALTSVIATGLGGCADPEYPTPAPVTTSAVGQARVLLVNAAPGSTAASLTVDASPFGPALPYLGISALTSVNAGARLLIYSEPTNIPATPAAAPAGTAPLTAPRTVVARSSFLGGTNYTIFLTDAPTRAYAFPVTATTDQGGIRTLTLTDNLAAPAAGNAKVRFVNLAPSGTYGIFNAGATPAAPLFAAVPTRAYRATTATVNMATTAFATFTEVPAGAYTLDVRSNAPSALAGTQQAVTFAAGKIYTLYVRGVANQTATPLGFSVVQHN